MFTNDKFMLQKKLRLYALIEDITIKGESCFEEK